MDESNDIKTWSSDSALNYFKTYRDTRNDLYKSEEYFLDEVLAQGTHVLDIGCAMGGFSRIVKEFNPRIKYTGVDISPRMIAEARDHYPDDQFMVTSGRCLDFADNSFDTVICFGVLHMTEQWEELISEAWRVCSGTVVFDIRTVAGPTVSDNAISYQRIESNGTWDGSSKAPYIVLNIDEFMDYLVKNFRNMSSLKSYGYSHPVSSMTVSPYKEVCMAAFSATKGAEPQTTIDWRLPLSSRLLPVDEQP